MEENQNYEIGLNWDHEYLKYCLRYDCNYMGHSNSIFLVVEIGLFIFLNIK